jgi:hypothetical protein
MVRLVEAEQRQHAVVELAIRDLKDQALAHFPSSQFAANSAWTVIAALAHNLLRWTTIIGAPEQTVPNARTTRRRLLKPPRPPDPPQQPMDTACPRPLALARGLHDRAESHPGAHPRDLTGRGATPRTI